MDSHEQDSFVQKLEAERIGKIRTLNDELRRCRRGGHMFVTQGVISLG